MNQQPLEKDWKYFRKLVPVWQESYMEKLLKEYAALLVQDKMSSEKFWELERRIREDKRRPGVVLDMRQSRMAENLVLMIRDGVIEEQDLDGFSDELKEEIQFYLPLGKNR